MRSGRGPPDSADSGLVRAVSGKLRFQTSSSRFKDYGRLPDVRILGGSSRVAELEASVRRRSVLWSQSVFHRIPPDRIRVRDPVPILQQYVRRQNCSSHSFLHRLGRHDHVLHLLLVRPIRAVFEPILWSEPERVPAGSPSATRKPVIGIERVAQYDAARRKGQD